MYRCKIHNKDEITIFLKHLRKYCHIFARAPSSFPLCFLKSKFSFAFYILVTNINLEAPQTHMPVRHPVTMCTPRVTHPLKGNSFTPLLHISSPLLLSIPAKFIATLRDHSSYLLAKAVVCAQACTVLVFERGQESRQGQLHPKRSEERN